MRHFPEDVQWKDTRSLGNAYQAIPAASTDSVAVAHAVSTQNVDGYAPHVRAIGEAGGRDVRFV